MSIIGEHPASASARRGVADFADAVNFARTPRLEIAVRGGGRNVADKAVCGDGLMVDLSLMTMVRTLVVTVTKPQRAEHCREPVPLAPGAESEWVTVAVGRVMDVAGGIR